MAPVTALILLQSSTIWTELGRISHSHGTSQHCATSLGFVHVVHFLACCLSATSDAMVSLVRGVELFSIQGSRSCAELHSSRVILRYFRGSSRRRVDANGNCRVLGGFSIGLKRGRTFAEEKGSRPAPRYPTLQLQRFLCRTCSLQFTRHGVRPRAIHAAHSSKSRSVRCRASLMSSTTGNPTHVAWVESHQPEFFSPRSPRIAGNRGAQGQVPRKPGAGCAWLGSDQMSADFSGSATTSPQP